jgi:PIN domain nuclease of toxin-antitoxin system
MHLLLDTCALLWLAGDRSKLSPKAAAAILGNAPLAFSAISALEIQRLHELGQMKIPGGNAEEWLESLARSYRLEEWPIDAATAALSARLPPIHKDPCDRMIIASALRHKASIVTADQIIPSYPKVKICW